MGYAEVKLRALPVLCLSATPLASVSVLKRRHMAWENSSTVRGERGFWVPTVERDLLCLPLSRSVHKTLGGPIFHGCI